MKLELEFKQSLNEIDESSWNQLGEADYPFTRHEFLRALESHNCLNEFGWQPLYILLTEQQTIIAAVACYIKTNSYGELVFDHSWAQAYERSGHHYYPKLVTAIPYTPATGPRFLVRRTIKDQATIQSLQTQLTRVIKQFCKQQGLSGWHLLFEREPVIKSLAHEQLLYRYDCQFHWHNQGYQSFEDFLAQLSSRKRKNIKKERASVVAKELLITQKFGDELTPFEWKRVYELYAGIFFRKYGTPTLTEDFFKAVGADLKHRVMVVLVENHGEIIATSLFFVSDSTLYGRVWGCDEFHDHLHFECCYYQGIDFCIQQGIQTFDPGAQGEHKISRGFLPTRTCSAHWMVDEHFHQLIQQSLQHEEKYISDYCLELAQRSPYRKGNEP